MRAAVLRDGRVEVRETADPVPGPGELLLKTLSTAICASDVHYMDHPGAAPRFVWDSDRDTVMGHEFVGEVIALGPDCTGDIPVGARVTSMPLLVRGGAHLVIGHHPDASGGFGERMVVSEVLARAVPDGPANDAVALVDAFAVGEYYVRVSNIAPGEIPLVVGAGAIGLSAVAALASRGVGPIVVSDYSAQRLAFARKFGAEVVVNPAERSPFDAWREVAQASGATAPPVIFECVGASGLLQSIVESCAPAARIFAAGGWYSGDSLSVTDATFKGVSVQFGGGPPPQDWYGTLDAVVAGRLDPTPAIGKVIGLDEIPGALELVRKAEGPPRIVIHVAGENRR